MQIILLYIFSFNFRFLHMLYAHQAIGCTGYLNMMLIKRIFFQSVIKVIISIGVIVYQICYKY